MTWHYDVIFLALSYPITFSLRFRFRWHSFHPLLIRYSRWTRSTLRHSPYAHLRVARAQCVYDFYFSWGFRRPTAQMPYRRAYKRPRYGKRDKYSVQQKAFQFSANSGTSSTWLLVPATTLEGMRKVKHLMVNLTIDPDSVGPMWWRSCMSLRGQQ